MADEQQQERTEQATPKRREEARRKGDVPRSRELTMTGVMLGGSAALLMMSQPIAGRIEAGMRNALSIDRGNIYEPDFLISSLRELATGAIVGLAPFFGVLIVTVLFGATAIGGWSFSAGSLAFKGERISPIKGITRIFSANSLNELLKAVAKFLLVGAIAVLWLWRSVDELLSLGHEPVAVAVPHAVRIAFVSLIVVSCSLIAISAADVPFQLWNYQKKIRMTRKEIRDELKETEGQPEVKSKVRFLQQQIASRRMMADLPGADVVITNPTHVAVALKYDEASMAAPKVIAKGQDLMAQRIREVAQASGVPLFSAPPLARALYRSVDIGQEISAGLYTAVAQVLAYIFQIDAVTKDGRNVPLPEPPVPEIDESLF
jgi:flagellar biosynthetic protein FlhB